MSILLLLVLVCGAAMPFTTKAQAAPTEITFWTFVDAHAKYWTTSADLWNKANPDKQITLTPTVYPWADMHSKLLLALQSGTGAPDMVDIEITKFPTFIKGDIHLQDITDLVDAVKDQLVASRLVYQWKGKQYGVDYHVGTFMMFYNKDVMDAAGVDIDSIKTWDDYIAAGKKVTKGDVWMTALETNGCQAGHALMLMNGGGTYDKDGNFIIDSAKNAEALQFMADLKLKDKIAEDAPGGGLMQQESYTALTAGKIASLWYPEWYIERFQDYLPDLKGKIRVRPMPTGFGTFASTMGGGTGTAITDQIDPAKLQLAKDFLKFAKLTPEAGVRIWKELGFDPIIKAAYTDPELTKPLPYFGNEDVFSIIKGMQDNLAPEYLGPLYADAWNIINAKTCYNILDNGAKPADELAAVKTGAEATQ
jgi:arabinosaccharide transport system substrate-binding protein